MLHARAFAMLVLLCLVTGCGTSRSGGVLPAQAPFDRAAATGAFSTIAIVPRAGGYLRGDVKGLQLWGSATEQIRVIPLDAAGGALTGPNAPSITVTSATPKRLTVAPAGTPQRFALQAVVATDASSQCRTCKVVSPGPARLTIVVTPKGKSAITFHVPVAVDHKIIAASLNPFPNPSIGGSDAVVQYYDDNIVPSVIWDDFYRKNTTRITGVGGVAFGADGTLYVANLGSGTPGTVTEYPLDSTSPTPSKTLTAPDLMGPQAVAVDAKGNVFVADNYYETVTRFPANGDPVTLLNNWPGGAGLYGIATDGRGSVVLALSGAGLYSPSTAPNVGTLAALSSTFVPHAKPRMQITNNGSNGVNQPYDVAFSATGQLYVVNDYVSIVNQPPGPGPIHSTLTRYDRGLTSASTLPDATTSAGLAWPLSVAVDLAGNVYVGNNAPPKGGSAPAPFFLREYRNEFGNDAKPMLDVNLTKGLPATWIPYYLNIEGIAVYPGPLQN